MRQIVLDTETTGLEVTMGHRLIEVAAIELVNRQISDRRFHSFLNPERPIDPQAMAVHKITDEWVSDKPKFAEIAASLRDFLDDAELIIHNAPFDLGFLNAEFERWDIGWVALEQRCTITDTLKLAQQRFPGQRNNLDALCKRFQISTAQRSREGHNALLDTRLLGQVYLAMTGGQSALCLKEIAEPLTPMLDGGDLFTPLPEPIPTNLPIIAATAEELAAHERWLAKLGPNNGWRRFVNTDAEVGREVRNIGE